MMQKQIVRRDGSPAQIPGLETYHPLLQRIYAARQVPSIDQLDRSLEQLHDFNSMLGIKRATELLADALRLDQSILIVGDFDADGATSTTIAMKALRLFGARKVQYLVPNRFAYGYGLTPELVEAAKQFAPELIVTVDNGIANHAGVQAAKDLGIKVLVTDHHLPSDTLPNADAIVNPNQHNDTFPSKNLAGCGVIFYVMLALRRYLVDHDWFTEKKIPVPNMSQLLDIVALGTVADLVPLDHNNRILVHQGLRRIRGGLCAPGIVGLLELAGRDFSRVTASDLGFAVAARLNAAGRLDDMSLGIECLLAEDAVTAREIARKLDQMNIERRSIESDMQAQALQALAKLTENLQGDLPRGLVLFDTSWHQGVIGILASRIKDRYHRPVIVFAPGIEEELKGSARSIPGLHVRDVMALMDARHPGLIKKFGGHAMAAGLTIHKDQLKNFIRIFDELVSLQLTEDQLRHRLISDGELTEAEISLDVAAMLRDAGPWGQAFPEPLFDDTFRIVEQRLVGDKHLKLRLMKDQKVIEAIAFFVDTQVWPNHRCELIRAAYRLDVNEYKGRSSVQLIIEYLEEVTS
jgi:single-stranded-DNA-specific exonuclease